MSQVFDGPQVGEVYKDLDKRRCGRTFRIEAILNDGKVLVKPLSGGTKMTKISLDRFKPWKYKLQPSAQATTPVPTPTPPLKQPSLPTNSPLKQPLPTNFFSAAKSAGLTTSMPTTPSQSLADKCKEIIPGNWKSEWSHIATLSQGCLGLIVRSIGDKAYDVKIKLDGLIVDTWSSQHIGLKLVLSHLAARPAVRRHAWPPLCIEEGAEH